MDIDDIEIVYENVVEFEIDNYNFTIEYNKTNNEWCAVYNDENEYDYSIVIPNDLDKNMELFNNFVLKVYYFNELKKLVIGCI